jgi:hypothetical protein
MLRLIDKAVLAKEGTCLQDPDDSLPTGLGDRREFDRPSAYVIESVFSVPTAKDRLPRQKAFIYSPANIHMSHSVHILPY